MLDVIGKQREHFIKKKMSGIAVLKEFPIAPYAPKLTALRYYAAPQLGHRQAADAHDRGWMKTADLWRRLAHTIPDNACVAYYGGAPFACASLLTLSRVRAVGV